MRRPLACPWRDLSRVGHCTHLLKKIRYHHNSIMISPSKPSTLCAQGYGRVIPSLVYTGVPSEDEVALLTKAASEVTALAYAALGLDMKGLIQLERPDDPDG